MLCILTHSAGCPRPLRNSSYWWSHGWKAVIGGDRVVQVSGVWMRVCPLPPHRGQWSTLFIFTPPPPETHPVRPLLIPRCSLWLASHWPLTCQNEMKDKMKRREEDISGGERELCKEREGSYNMKREKLPLQSLHRRWCCRPLNQSDLLSLWALWFVLWGGGRCVCRGSGVPGDSSVSTGYSCYLHCVYSVDLRSCSSWIRRLGHNIFFLISKTNIHVYIYIWKYIHVKYM